MLSRFISWVKREGGSLEALFHTTVNNIHAELARLEGVSATAAAKSNELTAKAAVLRVAAAEHTALAVTAGKVVADVRKAL